MSERAEPVALVPPHESSEEIVPNILLEEDMRRNWKRRGCLELITTLDLMNYWRRE